MKINKYLELIQQQSILYAKELKLLSESTLKAMDEAKLLFSEQGAVLKIQEYYNLAMEKARELKSNALKALLTILDTEANKLKEPAIKLTIEESILAELRKINEHNSLIAKYATMTVDELVAITEDSYLSAHEILLIRQMIMQKANGDMNIEMVARSIQHYSNNDLINEARAYVNQFTFGDDLFPGISITDSLTGGISKMMGIDRVNKANDTTFFGPDSLYDNKTGIAKSMGRGIYLSQYKTHSNIMNANPEGGPKSSKVDEEIVEN